jgi:hypothetical protein
MLPTEPPTEPSTEPSTEPTTELTTEPSTEPKSDLTVSQTEKPTLYFKPVLASNLVGQSIRRFTNKAGKLIVKYPFWVLVVSSVGIHTAFAFAMPNPIKKAEPREVVVSTLPIVKLPPKSLTPNPKSNKSFIDNLFDKSASKNSALPNTFPNTFPNSFPDTLSNSPLSTLDLSNLDNLDNLPPVTDFSFSTPPLSSDSKVDRVDPPQPAKPRPRVTETPRTSSPTMRFNPSGQIDNTNPVKPEMSSSNIKPEFKNGGLKTATNSPPDTKNTANSTSPDKVAKNIQSTNIQSTSLTDGANSDLNDKNVVNIAFGYPIDERLLALNEKGLIVNTIIAPTDKLVSAINYEREQGVVWVPPKTENISGKSGEAIFMWLVDPKGEVDTRYFKSSGNKEFDKIAKEAVKEYKFQPIADLKSGKYRLVTAKYKFP